MTAPERTARRRIVAAGSGRDGLDEPEICAAILALSGRAHPSVLYVGTASYDLSEPRAAQTARLQRLGCRIDELRLASATPTFDAMADRFDRADVILASGGNTLFAVDRWRRLGVDRLMREAMARGAVLCGGSAGAICWFDGGHSDSMDPRSSKRHKLADEPLVLSETATTRWEYIRVPGLGALPGLCCPHYDRTQNNGVPRAVDFQAMLLRHPGEIGIALDHFAALVVDGERYRVVSPDRPGSVDGERMVLDGGGHPGVWRLAVMDGAVSAHVVPAEGEVARILRKADAILEDPRLAAARAANPDDLP